MHPVILYVAAFLIIFTCYTSKGWSQQSTELKENYPGDFLTIEKKFPNTAIDGYNLYVPHSCTSESKPFPILMFFQGGLGVGGEVEAIYNWELPKKMRETHSIDSELDELRMNTFVVIMPHISKGQFYDNVSGIEAILEEVISNYHVDGQRIYLTGLSRGGHGTWGVASRIPGRFLAIAPIAGAGHGIESYKTLATTPILTSHNKDDDIVNYKETYNIVKKIEAASNINFHRGIDISQVDFRNNDHIFISSETGGHNAWSEVYDSVDFYHWLLKYQ